MAPGPKAKGKPEMGRRGKKKGRPVSGWLVLDKPWDFGSTEAVSKIKWLFKAEKAGHAGTLDPLASGMLPIALGDATKTVPYVMDGRKIYEFTVAWGEERNTDDLEGEVTASSDARPERRPSRRSCRLHRRHRAGSAGLFRRQDRRRARL
jgi:tRNA pseudouridine55 synthase